MEDVYRWKARMVKGKNAFDFSVPLEIAASGKRSTETGEEW